MPTVRGALTEMDDAIQKIRDRNMLAGLMFEAPFGVLDLVERYHATAEALDECGRLLCTLQLQRYWGIMACTNERSTCSALHLGARRFGQGRGKKITLIVDSEPHRYQIFCSDISGQDVRVHKKDPVEAIKVVRNWLRTSRPDVEIPGGTMIAKRYKEFTEQLPELKQEMHLGEDKLTFADYVSVLILAFTGNIRVSRSLKILSMTTSGRL